MAGTGLPRWAALAAVASGAAVGLLAERAWSRRTLAESAVAPDPAVPHGTQVLRVLADDGHPIHVEIDTPADWAPGQPTVVLVHGFALDLTTWQHQRRALRSVARVIAYDHRGHARSAAIREVSDSPLTIDRLGRDLGTVVSTYAGDDVVLMGHSMGGMTIMALAERHPDWFGGLVRGVALLGTTAGAIPSVTLGLPKPVAALAHRLTPLIGAAAENETLRQAVTRLRGSGSDVSRILTRTYAFGESAPEHGTELVDYLLASTDLPVVADLLADIGRHDRRHALDVVGRVPVLIMVGDQDRLTPKGHSRRIHEAIPESELIVLAGVGHMLTLEAPERIDDVLCDFVRSIGG